MLSLTGPSPGLSKTQLIPQQPSSLQEDVSSLPSSPSLHEDLKDSESEFCGVARGWVFGQLEGCYFHLNLVDPFSSEVFNAQAGLMKSSNFPRGLEGDI